MLTLGMWGDDGQQQPLQITATDKAGMSPFAIAVVRGHLELAKAILEIAQAQYKVVETKRNERYEMDDDASDMDSDSDSDEIRIVSETVDDKFTVDDIGALDFDAGSTVSPTSLVINSYPLSMFIQNANVAPGPNHLRWFDLMEYAIRMDDVALVIFLLEIGQLYQPGKASGPQIFTVDEVNIYLAIEHGRLRCLEEIISRTGADLPLDQLVKKSGVQVHEKPKYYQGLSIHGRKRTDWAAAGRGILETVTVDRKSPLLVSAFRGEFEQHRVVFGNGSNPPLSQLCEGPRGGQTVEAACAVK